METVIFDLKGPFAHFRAYDTTRRNMTYSFPPKTAVIGLIAGILGLPRNTYWENSPLKDAKISLKILNPIWRSSITTNYLQLKYPLSLAKGIKIFMAKDPFEINSKEKQRGFNAPIRLNILRNVNYRIFFQSENDTLMGDITRRLQAKKYCFPPYLGHANMLAEIQFIGKKEIKNLEKGLHEVHSIVPVSSLDQSQINLDTLGYSVLFNVPNKLSLSDKKTVYLSEVKNLILNETAEKHNVRTYFKANKVKEVSIKDTSYKIIFW